MSLPYSIDAYAFHLLEGSHPKFPQQHVITETRTGLNGVAAIAVGSWADPMESITTRWYTLLADAIAAAKGYHDYVSPLPRVLIFQGVNWFLAYNMKFIVTGVEVEQVQGLPMVVADIAYSPAWQVKARWRLQPVFITP